MNNDLYRDSYIKQKIKGVGISEESEVESGLSYVKDRLNEDDSNMDDVMKEYEIAMRVEGRKPYVDLGLGNGFRSKYKQINGKGYGRSIYHNAKKAGRK